MSRDIAEAPPGRRFTTYYGKRRERDPELIWKKWLYILLGAAMVFVGTAISIPPIGIPGFLLWIPGLAMIAVRLKSVAFVLDKTEAGLRRLYRKLKGKPKLP